MLVSDGICLSESVHIKQLTSIIMMMMMIIYLNRKNLNIEVWDECDQGETDVHFECFLSNISSENLNFSLTIEASMRMIEEAFSHTNSHSFLIIKSALETRGVHELS